METSFGPCRLLVAGLVAIALSLNSCDIGLRREEGDRRPAELRMGVVAGKVTDRITSAHIAGVSVTFEPAVAEMDLSMDLHPTMAKIRFSTDPAGFFYARIPIGHYRLTFSKDHYRGAERNVVVSADRKVTSDLVLDPAVAVSVYAGKDVTGGAPGSGVHLKAAVYIEDRSTLRSLDWTVQQQDGHVRVTISEKKGTAATVVLPGAARYKEALLDRLGRQGRLLNRWMVLGLGPSDLIEAGTVTLGVRAITSSGQYSDTVNVIADVSAFAAVNPGLQNVPIGEPVLLQGKEQASYLWSIARPAGSAATLKDPKTQNPHFTPDVPGVYRLAEGGKTRITIYAGTWNGAIAGRTTNRPWIGLKGCSCHYNDRITPKLEAWWTSGHAEIFSHNITTSFRYERGCFACHTVGFHAAGNGGIKDDPAYASFLKDTTLWDVGTVPPIVKPAPGHWDYVRDSYPGVAKLANVQCENCHGPNNSEAHKTLKATGAPERVSLSADVCGPCHDASVDISYRQWQESGHSNYRLAMDVATVEKRGDAAKTCGRCHAGQGFLAWTDHSKRTKEIQGKKGDASLDEVTAFGLTAEEVHPSTCAICHEPHNPGNSFRSRIEKVPVRISDDARMHPSEFRGNTGGRGALCIICHSTDSGPHNDTAIRLLTSNAAPHASQADVLMGQNAFFVEIGKNKSHSQIEDTCIWCHMKPVPKKSRLGYLRGGVNHTFKTSPGLCSQCHNAFDGEELMVSTERDLENLKGTIQTVITANINRNLTVKLIKAENGTTDVMLKASDIRKLDLVEFRGNMAVEVTSGQGVYKVPLSQVYPGGTPLLSTSNGQVIAKAAWNHLLLKNDGSKGAHNPQFVAEVLEATMTKIMALTL